MSTVLDVPADALSERLGERLVARQVTADGIPTAWVAAGDAPAVLADLKKAGYAMLYDLTAIDERHRKHRDGQPCRHGTGLTQAGQAGDPVARAAGRPRDWPATSSR